LIDSIDVIGHEEIVRLDKKTIVFIVEFTIKDQKFQTKRSYNEFKNLHKDISKSKADIKLPELPPKRLL
jgi:hypothetical protein